MTIDDDTPYEDLGGMHPPPKPQREQPKPSRKPSRRPFCTTECLLRGGWVESPDEAIPTRKCQCRENNA